MPFEKPDESIPVLITQIIVGVISVCGNLTILYIVFIFEKFRSSICNCLIGLLAFNEFFDGISLIATAIHILYKGIAMVEFDNRLESCMLFGLLGIFGAISGQLTTFAMALDRFLAIRKPLIYYRNNSKIRLYLSVAVSIIIGIFYVFFATYNLDNKNKPDSCSTGGSVTYMFTVSYALFSAIIAIFIFGVYLATVVMLKHSKSGDRNIALSLQRQRKVFVSISLILLSYAIFWCIPLFIGIFIVLTSSDDILLGYMSLTIGLCSGINSCVGIFIYMAKHQELKECFFKIFPIFRSKKEKRPITLVSTINKTTSFVIKVKDSRRIRSPGF